MALNPTPADACGLMDQSIPQWKRELITRRRALGRSLQVGSSSVKLTCPAVVAVVRQPELLVANENATSTKSLSTEESSSTSSSLNQNRLDFHPSASSASAASASVGNMRLLDTCGDVNKSKQSEVNSSDLCVNYNLIMGEDKSFNLKKKTASSRMKCDHKISSVNSQNKILLNLIDKVPNSVSNGELIKDEECQSDSSEELQYGPGIVNKLKSKYLSMTLREQKRILRPSIMNLRRATSLENMLEDGDLNKQSKSAVESSVESEQTSYNRISYVGKPVGLTTRSRTLRHLGNGSLDTMKRARSMDTLVKPESRTAVKNKIKTSNKQIVSKNTLTTIEKPIVSIVNENIVIVEKALGDSSISNETSKEDGAFKGSPKHSTRGNNVSGELPPPDLVKQTLKIFETSPKRTMKTTNQATSNKFVGLSTSNNQLTNNRIVDKTTFNSNKPTISPKPVLSPEKLRQNRSRISSPKKAQSNSNGSIKIRPSSSPTKASSSRPIDKQQLKLEIGASDSKSNCSAEALNQERTVTASSPRVTSPRSVSPIVTVLSNNDQVSPVSRCHPKSESIQSLSSTLDRNGFAEHKGDPDEVDSSQFSKPVLENDLENIRRGSVSMQFSFKNEISEQTSTTKSHLPRAKTPQALNTLVKEKLEHSPPTASVAPLRSSQTKQVGIIRPLVTTKIPSSPPLTEQEIEKNLINRVKSIEQPISKVVVAIKAIPDNVVLGSVSSDIVTNKNLALPRVCSNSKTKSQGLWDDKHWNQNTIVFNFSDRKEVPDYIENDGLILRGKRDRPRPGEGGIILLDGAVAAEESSTDTDPPSPCDVTFVGDNILINGKSNLKKSPKQVKLRIKFNDEATTMFEYPSEASLVEEELAASGATDENDSHTSAAMATPNNATASTAAATALPLSLGGSLGAYTPRQLETRDWQLGMAPAPAPAHHQTQQQQQMQQEHLKPASPDETVTWSEDTASDLLF